MGVVKFVMLLVVSAFLILLSVIMIGVSENTFAATQNISNELLGIGTGTYLTDFAPVQPNTESVINDSTALTRFVHYNITYQSGLVNVFNSSVTDTVRINYTWLRVTQSANLQINATKDVMLSGMTIASVFLIAIAAFAVMLVLMVLWKV